MVLQTLTQSTVFAPTERYAAKEAQTSPPRSGDAAQLPVAAAFEHEPILPTASIFDAIDLVLDLSSEGRGLLEAYSSLGADDQQTFLGMLAELLKQGVIGQETLELGGQPYTTFATTRLGDPKLMHAPAYHGSGDIPARLDLLA